MHQPHLLLTESLPGSKVSVDELWLDSSPHYPLDRVLETVLDNNSPRALQIGAVLPHELAILRPLRNCLVDLQITIGQWNPSRRKSASGAYHKINDDLRFPDAPPFMDLPKLQTLRVVLNLARSMGQATAAEELDFGFRTIPSLLNAPSLVRMVYFFNGCSQSADSDHSPGELDWQTVRRAFKDIRSKSRTSRDEPTVRVTWREGQEAALDLQADLAGLDELKSAGILACEPIPQKARIKQRRTSELDNA